MAPLRKSLPFLKTHGWWLSSGLFAVCGFLILALSIVPGPQAAVAQSSCGSGEPCCGGQPYDPDTELCCNDTIQPKDPEDSCCDTQSYDSSTHGCCNDSEVYELATQGCCNDTEVYELATECCCVANDTAYVVDKNNY